MRWKGGGGGWRRSGGGTAAGAEQEVAHGGATTIFLKMLGSATGQHLTHKTSNKTRNVIGSQHLMSLISLHQKTIDYTPLQACRCRGVSAAEEGIHWQSSAHGSTCKRSVVPVLCLDYDCSDSNDDDVCASIKCRNELTSRLREDAGLAAALVGPVHCERW